LDRRVVLLERAVLPRGDAADRAWDAVLTALSTDELRALLAYMEHEDPAGAHDEHLERALGALERAGGVEDRDRHGGTARPRPVLPTTRASRSAT